MKTGLALSGGGVRGAAHIGVLQALREAHVELSAVSGTSAGAIVASLFAAGYSPEELHALFEAPDPSQTCGGLPPSLFDPDIRGLLRIPFRLLLHKPFSLLGLLRGERLEKFLRRLFTSKGITRMEDIPMPVAIPAVDIQNARTVIFTNRADLPPQKGVDHETCAFPWEAVRASCAFPGVFHPKIWHGRMLCDGGIVEDLPDRILHPLGADCTIAVDLGYCGQQKRDISNAAEISSQALNIMSYEIRKCRSGPDCLVIRPKIYDVGLLEWDRLDECMERGYLAARDALSRR